MGVCYLQLRPNLRNTLLLDELGDNVNYSLGLIADAVGSLTVFGQHHPMRMERVRARINPYKSWNSCRHDLVQIIQTFLQLIV